MSSMRIRASGANWYTDLYEAPIGTLLILSKNKWLIKQQNDVWLSSNGIDYHIEDQKYNLGFFLSGGYRLLYR